MVYVLTDNQFLFLGIELLLRKHGVTASRLSVNEIRGQMMSREHLFIIGCPLHEENIQFLIKLYNSGAQVCFLQQRVIECMREDPPSFIDINSMMNDCFPTEFKKIVYSISDLLKTNELKLTNQEIMVSRLVLCGLSGEDIASVLSISKRTAQHHINRVLKKLGSKSVADIFLQRNVIYASLSLSLENCV
ncbi:DNA-binding transcriptional activator EvgA [Klebsiella michiganensis]|uniref:helix-turn-helix domain-containing protein n=1 Tax=Klebsiella michiganensis TaxID=1134687 RepID=UPI000E04C1CC|nr:DNA-binding transcriptional activator EvgA [Klebsiella michiganensis]